MKRLDIGEGTYALELEEDVGIMDAVSRVSITNQIDTTKDRYVWLGFPKSDNTLFYRS